MWALQTSISNTLAMLKYYRIVKVCCVGTFFGLVIFYVGYWEPYCFFKRPLHSEGISSLNESKIFTYGFLPSPSNNTNLIAILTPKISFKLKQILQLLDLNLADNFTTNVLFIYNNNAYEDDLLRLSNSTRRQVLFLDVDHAFNLFPIGFDPCRTKTSFYRRGKWNYQLMIRFWFKILFQLPQLQEYEYIMRLDDDSKLTGRWINVFDEMRNKNAVYFSNGVDKDLEEWWPGTMKMKQITFEYVKQNNITVKQPEMLRDAFGNNSVRNYYNNFEITKVKFFQRQDVFHWVEFIDSTYGIFKYRWGDAVLRYLTLALFAERQEILHRPDYNLPYCHSC
jgi:hypothetical protein